MTETAFSKVAIHGVPRSGTSWVGEIFNSSPHVAYRFQPLFSYAHKDFLCASSSGEQIDSFFSRLLKCCDDFTLQNEKRASGEFPVFEKTELTHVVYKEVRYINILENMLSQCDDVQLVAVIRNPLSVVNSWLKAPREFRVDLGWSAADEWRLAPKKNLGKPEEYNGFDKWKEAANIFLKLKAAYPDRVYIQKYSEILSNPLGDARKMLDFTGIEFGAATESFLMPDTDEGVVGPYSVYRRVQTDDGWRKSLDPTIIEAITADLSDTPLEDYLTT